MVKKATKTVTGQLIEPRVRMALRDLPKTNNEIEDEAVSMLEWAKLPSSFDLPEYPLSKGFRVKKFFALSEKSEFFADCLESSRTYIATRLRKLWREDGYKKDYVLRFLPFYDEEFKEDVMLRLNQANAALASSGQKTFTPVYLDKIPDSPLVPVRQ